MLVVSEDLLGGGCFQKLDPSIEYSMSAFLEDRPYISCQPQLNSSLLHVFFFDMRRPAPTSNTAKPYLEYKNYYFHILKSPHTYKQHFPVATYCIGRGFPEGFSNSKTSHASTAYKLARSYNKKLSLLQWFLSSENTGTLKLARIKESMYVMLLLKLMQHATKTVDSHYAEY